MTQFVKASSAVRQALREFRHRPVWSADQTSRGDSNRERQALAPLDEDPRRDQFLSGELASGVRGEQPDRGFLVKDLDLDMAGPWQGRQPPAAGHEDGTHPHPR